jgi:putative DNA primase/helicase
VRQLLTHLEAWRGVIWLDEFTNKVMKAKPPPYQGGKSGEWSDFDDTMTSDYLAARCDIRRLKSGMVGEVVHAVATLHARNPLVDYLKACREAWIRDGRTPRLHRWLIDYLGAGVSPDDTQGDMERLEKYLALIGRHWMKGAVARPLRPGCTFHEVLILEGHQGLGKSSALAILGGEYAMDTPFSLSDKEGWESLIGAWIVEIAELDAMNKADHKTSKTFFSRRKDRFRLPFARRSRDFLRTCVFAGTTNEHEYFRDRTGNRRYLPAHCRRDFDRDKLERDRDLLFGEAVDAVEAGERLWLTKEELALVRVEQQRRLRQDPWFGKLARWLADPMRARDLDDDGRAMPVTITRLIQAALGAEVSRADEHGWSTRIGHALAELGYVRLENKSLPERYHYVKRQSSEEGDA